MSSPRTATLNGFSPASLPTSRIAGIIAGIFPSRSRTSFCISSWRRVLSFFSASFTYTMPSRTVPASPAPIVANVLRTSRILRISARTASTRSRVSRRDASGADLKLIWNSARSSGVKNSVLRDVNATIPPMNASVARASIVLRCPRAHAIIHRYRSDQPLNRSRIRATRCRFPFRSMSGSIHLEESIGSRVNDTKRETSTAKATVIPNWKKNRPTIPFMNATGTKTATMERVVAITASPISAVPARAASKWSCPCSRCRTMFSRTTIASSMRRPMARDSAISVMTLSVIPMKFMTMKEEMTEIGRVSPVITVERHELRKQKTMKMVRIPPRIKVVWTSSTESRIMVEASRTISILVPGGSSGCSRAISFFARSTTETVFAPDCFWTSSAPAGPRLLDPVDHVGHLAQQHGPPVPLTDHHRREAGHLHGLPRNAQREFGPVLRQPPKRGVDVFGPDPRDHLVHAHAKRLEARLVDVDVDLPFRRPHQVDLPHAGDVLEAPLDLFLHKGSEVLRRKGLGPDREGYDRRRREVQLLDDRLLDPVRQFAPDGCDLGPRLLGPVVQLHLELELDHDRGDALAGDRDDFLHAGDRVDRLLDPLADLALDALRRGAGEFRVDGDDGGLHVVEHVDREPLVGEGAQRHQGQHHDRGEDGALDREVGEKHRLFPRGGDLHRVAVGKEEPPAGDHRYAGPQARGDLDAVPLDRPRRHPPAARDVVIDDEDLPLPGGHVP